MAFKSVLPKQKRFVKLAECKPGDVLAEGVYQGPIEGNYGTEFQVREGETIVTLPSSSSMAKQFSNVPAGATVRVIYEDKVQMTQGKFKGKFTHVIDVQMDDAEALKKIDDLDNLGTPGDGRSDLD